MAAVSPLLRWHQQAEAALQTYGPPEAGVQVVETFGELELEYAALRKHCVLIDQAQRGTIQVTGADRLAFLNRMVTQELKGLAPFQVRRSFWLNRKGRIDADLRILELSDRTLLDLDVHAVERTMQGLSAYIITEDVQLRDETAAMHRLSLHGPTGLELLRTVAIQQSGASLNDLGPGSVAVLTIAGHEVFVDRQDSAGEVGLELLTAAAHVEDVYQQLLEAGLDPDGNGAGALAAPSTAPGSRIRLRQAGWHAFNIARIEAGWPLYNVDFGPDSLPAQSGVLEDRVSFTKGCYLGQEIVARMHSRGHSKSKLVGLRVTEAAADPETAAALQPVSGARVLAKDVPEGDAIGAVTSSTLSPMLGSAPICFAMIKPEHGATGTELLVEAAGGGRAVRAAVQPSLRFWARGEK